MNRFLDVLIDKKTWPKRGMPAFPASFLAGKSQDSLNIPAMLWMIGYLTTPTSSTGVSLSEFWAWVRYFSALTGDDDIRLTRSFSDLDAHQKTILSDDFGMGVPMLWLSEKLSLVHIVDGRYFLKKFAATTGATQIRTSKRGPNKTPDFVARDSNGNWHVIECKGTQSGDEYRDQQLGNKGPPATGGVAQKNSIIFPARHTGQRLACGLRIGIEGQMGSQLKIVDPEPEDPIEISTKQLPFAFDSATRGVMSKYLRMAGLEISAEAIASPLGDRPDSVHYKSRTAERERQEMVNERDNRAKEELRNNKYISIMNRQFRGQERIFDLPREISVGSEKINRIIVKQGINPDFLGELSRRPTFDELIQEENPDLSELVGRSIVVSDALSSKIKVGDIFEAELILEKSRK
ncbi:hypothetical protein [Pectobacterium sp. A5351]|uniref:hypothetical protein n=1 Tax=Pectobacterium sp. A5351 TaxID=2914983 RepID=UPI0023307736|nr:hypothetical protein [Pectobacterium sp. A5351]WCG81460.1 hypothetical protein O1Q74_10810 [Pectobacterium sp. A5351]